MKTLSRYFLLISFFIWAGCSENFLENPPLDTITDETFPVSPEDALLATNAIYSTYRNWWIEGGFPLTDLLSDDQTKGSEDGSNPDLQLIVEYRFSPTHPYILPFYQTLYQAVRRSNIVIENLPRVEGLDPGLADRYLGEARFLRAFTYFKLVSMFGGVPKITQVNPELFVPRTDEEEMLDFIIEDLEEAAGLLPEKSEYENADMGRVTRGAAKAMLARVYLFRNDFSNVERYALEVINSGQYQLENTFSEAFSINNVHGPESIFELGALPFFGRDQGGNQFGNTQGVRGSPNWGWGFGRPTWDLINFFETDDPRQDQSIIFLGEEIGGVTILGNDATTDTLRNENGDIIEIECYNQKVYAEGAEDSRDGFGHNRRFIRYADVLLMAAEALNENNRTDEALLYLNQVRQRARHEQPDILPDVTLRDKEALRAAIWSERRSELAFETLRFVDLKRQGRLTEVLGPLGFETGKHEYLPIPQQEIDLSGGRLQQNPNWN